MLRGARWLWVGTDFVQSDMIAFASPANAAPYLYAVPPDLACFGNLLTAVGVRARFGPSDYCQARARPRARASARARARRDIALPLARYVSRDAAF